ncbi:MAG TPA: hypothetical protein VMD78_15645 [Candidatus Baltobacteraceae bacterium]|nr:hypothetical protein [Candidatus Baltobacteraceae bacterium]
MTEFFRKDREAIVPDEPRRVDPGVPETSASRTVPATESRALITPPPATGGAVTSAAAARAVEEERIALFPSTEANELRARWDSIQTGFVDEPRKAVAEADALVSATMNRLSEVFAHERQRLEQQWDRSEDTSTEDFRLALRRYRSFFSRLLSI